MAQDQIKGRVIAMLATDGFEQVELTDTRERLQRAGARVDVLAPSATMKPGEIRGWKFKEWGDAVKVDRAVEDARPEEFDALVLPGGVINPDKLRLVEEAVQFVKDFAATGKPLAAICHGPQILVNAGVLQGRTLTSWPSLQPDLCNAGGEWKDAEVVVDGQLITSRKPEDIPAFSRAVIEAVAQSQA